MDQEDKDFSEEFSDLWGIFLIMLALYGWIDLDALKEVSNKYVEAKEDTEEDIEFRKAGVCERAISDTKHARVFGHFPTVKKDGDSIRCHGYIYSMNQEVCDDCEKCPFQYGHPFDPYWNKKVFNIDKEFPNPFNEITKDICSIEHFQFNNVKGVE